MRTLKNEGFDLIIDLHHNIRTFRVKQALRRPAVSFFKANFAKWLFVNFKINRLPQNHIVDRYLATLDRYSVENDGHGLDFFFDETTTINLPDLPPRFLVIALGTAHATKQIPLEKLKHLVKTKAMPFVLIGGKDVDKTGQLLAEYSDNVLNFSGQLGLEESARIIEKSIGLITGDTGMMHIGAALKKKMIVFWGNTVTEFGMYPYYGSDTIEFKNMQVDISCRPCSKTGFKECPKGHFKCMMDQDMDEVSRSIAELFDV